MKIVIAEDDAVDLQLLPLTLDRMGQEVVVTRTRTEAWKRFDCAPVRLVVSDWMIPRGWTAWHFVTECQRVGRYCIPALFFSPLWHERAKLYNHQRSETAVSYTAWLQAEGLRS